MKSVRQGEKYVPTGLVTINVGNGDEIARYRMANANDGARLGKAIGSGDAKATYLDTRPWQPLLAFAQSPEDAAHNRAGPKGSYPLLATFGSFNLHPMGPADARRRRTEIEGELVFAGFSVEPYSRDTLTQVDNALAAAVQGSFSTHHTGSKTAYPGELLEWRAYSEHPDDKAEMDEVKAARQQHTVREYPADYYPVRLEPFDEEKAVRDVFIEAFAEVNRDLTAGKITIATMLLDDFFIKAPLPSPNAQIVARRLRSDSKRVNVTITNVDQFRAFYAAELNPTTRDNAAILSNLIAGTALALSLAGRRVCAKALELAHPDQEMLIVL